MKIDRFMKVLLLLPICLALSGCVDWSTPSNQSVNNTPLRTGTSLPTVTPSLSLTTTPIPPSVQKAPDCKISNIKILPFEALKGEFGEEIKPNEDPGFFNAFGTSLFVVVEISSQAYFEGITISEANKDIKVEITVMEYNQQKTKKIEQISLHLLMNGGKIFVPLWVDPLMCSDVKINARIIGQKTVSTMKRTVPFSCAE